MNFDVVDRGCVAKSEVHAEVVGGKIAAAAEHIAALAYPGAGEVDRGTYRIARTLRPADELEFYPVVMIGIHVAKKYRCVIDIVDDHVDLAVVEQIAESGSAADRHDGEAGAFDSGHRLELSVFQIVEQ